MFIVHQLASRYLSPFEFKTLSLVPCFTSLKAKQSPSSPSNPILLLSFCARPINISFPCLSAYLMRKVCPNFDFPDGLDTVLEVPIPEEMFALNKSGHRPWQNMKSWMNLKPSSERSPASMTAIFGGRNTEIQLLLGVIGAPLIPLPIKPDHDHFTSKNIKDHPIEASMAKYIVTQYIAAVGGEKALNSINSMYAMGKVKMAASEFSAGEGGVNNKLVKVRNLRNGGGEMGGFVLWQKRPDLWCLELVVSGCKISAGSDGKVAWRQTPWHHSHASRGPPRPLRRFLQVSNLLLSPTV